MHMLIGVIVEAVDESDATSQAETILEGLTGEGNYPFDYFALAGESDRAEGIPTVALASTDPGAKIIADGMAATKRDFMEALARIRKALGKYNDEELFTGEAKNKGTLELGMFRYDCHAAGQYAGSNVWLYDQDGAGIRDDKHLARVLAKWGAVNTNEVYVVCADVHF
jgi:hypothetical protein